MTGLTDTDIEVLTELVAEPEPGNADKIPADTLERLTDLRYIVRQPMSPKVLITPLGRQAHAWATARCAICDRGFTAIEWVARHSVVDGPAHDLCCPNTACGDPS